MARLERVNELVRRELGQIILREINLEPGVLVTIMEVETSVDLQQAKILISIFPSNKGATTLARIEKNIYHLQQILNKRLRMRPVPKIRFDLVEW